MASPLPLGRRSRLRWNRAALIVLSTALLATCRSSQILLPPPGDSIALGTWGGDNAGMIVTDSQAHVHVGCTYGDMPGRVALDSVGRFSMAGSYLLRAYQIAVGPTLPAQFAGQLVGANLTFTVTVSDTIEKKTVILGPVTVTYATEPRLGPCPICRVPKRVS